MVSERSNLLLVRPGEGVKTDLGGLGVDFKVWGESTQGGLAIVEHPMAPGRLVPPHMHENEDELSYVLEGTFGVRIGDEIAEAGPGTYVYKPKGVPHTFWNATSRPARMIEFIVPAGFERFFEAMGKLGQTRASPQEYGQQRAELATRYKLSFVSGWEDELKARFGLKLLGEP